jgi:heat shock protein HslJ
VRGPGFAIDFHPDSSFIAYTGCKRVGGDWRQEDDKLVMTPTGATTATCRDPVGGCERRLLQILTRPMTISHPDGRTVVLSGESGSATLWKPGEGNDLFETRVSPCPALPD